MFPKTKSAQLVLAEVCLYLFEVYKDSAVIPEEVANPTGMTSNWPINTIIIHRPFSQSADCWLSGARLAHCLKCAQFTTKHIGGVNTQLYWLQCPTCFFLFFFIVRIFLSELTEYVTDYFIIYIYV